MIRVKKNNKIATLIPSGTRDGKMETSVKF